MKKIFLIIAVLFLCLQGFAKEKYLYPPFSSESPREYDFSEGLSFEEFFKKYYKATWNKLSSFEQYAIAFSCNLFQMNNLYHLDFTGKTALNSYASDPAAVLKGSWGITDHESLVSMFNSLEEYGHSGAYQMLCGLLDKYPDKSPLEIGIIEHLEILDITRLMFVRDTREAAGIHGIEAWDEGREITIIRWGIASGYITENEAKTLLEPVIARIKDNYNNWKEYSEHYWLGRQFYALTDCTQSEKSGEAIYNDYMAHAYIPLDSLKFTGKNAAKTYRNAIAFEEGEDFKKWQTVQKLANEDITEKQFEELLKIEQDYAEYSDVFFWWHLIMLCDYATKQEIVDYVEAHMNYLETMNKEDRIFGNSMYYYLSALNDTFHPQKVLSILQTLPENLQTNIHYYYQYALANFYMMNFCVSQAEYDAYKSRAINAFMLLKQYDYDIGSKMEGWLKAVN